MQRPVLVLSVALLLLLVGFIPSAFAEEAGVGPKASKSNEVSTKAKPPLVITSETLEVDNKLGRVLFKGNVIAEEEFLLCSDELYLGYGDGTQLDSMVAIGGVVIVHGERVSGADRAEYKRDDRIIVLTGSAVIVECGDTVRGERIEIYLDEERAVVNGDSAKSAGGRVRAVILPQKLKSCEEASVVDKTETSLRNTAEDKTGSGAVSSKNKKRGTDGESRCGWARQVLR
jgi:lipopolysaccharide transport protein LptA